MTLREQQQRIKELEESNGWINPPDAKITFLVEEMGEVAKWVRKSRGQKLNEEEREELGFELADVLQHLISLANEFDLDLERSVRKKKGID
ncbi:MAG TPA: MazG nucleotide pyrophosphohydrolase domain-containing protein [Blastocatellia bacterium]|nr:MazG nucleotide pyrophosphohydrolase domain-containing protein [Blastocatellia bacterium]